MRVIGLAALLLIGIVVEQRAYAAPEHIVVTDLDVVSSRRVGRTSVEYTMRIAVDNPSNPLTDVVGTASSNSAATIIVEPTIEIGDFATGALSPADTFTIQHNRRYRFSPANITVAFTGSEVAQNQAPQADAGVDQITEVGRVVSLDGSGSNDPDGDTLTYFWALTTPPGSTAALSNSVTPNAEFTPDIPGQYMATLTVNDGELTSSDNSEIAVAQATPNNPPVITSSPNITGSTGAAYSYNVVATDLDPGDELTYTLQLAPTGMTIDATTGLINWVPPASGAYDVDVVVTDSVGLNDRQIYLIQVNAGTNDTAPTINAIPAQVVVVGQTLTLTATGSDPENEPLRFSVDNPPANLAINSATGVLTWTPATAQIGDTEVIASVSDPGGQTDSTAFTVAVLSENMNNAPVIDPIDDQTINALATLNLTVTAVDPDAGDVLTYGLDGAPAGLQFDAEARRLTWTPGTEDVGTINLTAVVTDSFGDSSSTAFAITVVEPPIAPVAQDDAYTVRHRDTLNIPTPGVLDNDTDANNDTLTAQNQSAPNLGTLDAFSGDGSFQYSPPPIPPITVGFAEQCQTANHRGATSRNYSVSVADVDADGDVEIVVVDAPAGGANSHSGVSVYDGTSCAVESQSAWERLDGENYGTSFSEGTATLVNLDADPELEVVVSYGGNNTLVAEPVGARARLLAMNLDGTPVWGTTGLSEEMDTSVAANTFRNLVPSPVDLDGDGQVELLIAVRSLNGTFTGPSVIAYNGQTGEFLWRYSSPFLANPPVAPNPWVIADIDLDGTVEILFGDSVIDHTGNLEFRLPQISTPNFLTMGLANLDTDPFAEIIAVDATQHTVYNHDGTVVLRTPRAASLVGGVTIAELDGDPGLEYVINEAADFFFNLTAFNAEDASIVWTHNGTEFEHANTSAAVGATIPMAFDFNRDGIDELVQHIEATADGNSDRGIYVFNGDDGAVVAFDSVPFTVIGGDNDLLTIADVDGDGAAEVLQRVQVGFEEAVRVLEGLPGNPFPPARAIRNEKFYQPTAVNEDGAIPRSVPPAWLIPGLNKHYVAAVIPGESETSTDSFTYLANDGNADSNIATVDITIATVNAPTIVSTPPPGGSPGFEYSYPAFATDADFGDTLTWSLPDAPAGMTINSFGIVSWTPTEDDLGNVRVLLVVTDSAGNTATQDFSVAIEPPSTVPDVLGQGETEAGDAIAGAGLNVGQISQNFSLTVPAGQVISQSIAGGALSGAGSFVDIVISLGPPPIFTPTLAGLNESAAQAELEALGLALGTITNQNSDTAPRGSVISQSVASGTQLELGESVDVVLSSGPALRVTLQEFFIASGAATNLAIQAFDQNGLEIALPPTAVNVEANADATGAMPQATTTEITTGADTAGTYRVDVDVPGYGTAQLSLIVRPGFDANDYLTPVATLASTIATLPELYTNLAEALTANDLPAVQSLAQDLVVLRNSIDLDVLARRNPMAPQTGFLPSVTEAQTAGFPAGVSELNAAVPAHVNLRNAFASVDSFIAQLSPLRARNDDIRAIAINNDLALTANTLSNLTLSVGAQVQLVPQNYLLLAQVIPERVAGDIDFVLSVLSDAGLLAFEMEPTLTGTLVAGAPREAFSQTREAFFSAAGMVIATSIRSAIIENFYMPQVTRLLSSAGVLVTADAIRAQMSPIELSAIITGASQSFHTFELDGSIVEGIELTNAPQALQVTAIGPDLFQNVLDFVGENDPPTDVRGALDYADGLREAVSDGLGAGVRDAETSAVLRGCFFDQNPDCGQIVLTDGFPSVHSNGQFPAPVLILVQDNATGQLYMGVYAFFPG